MISARQRRRQIQLPVGRGGSFQTAAVEQFSVSGRAVHPGPVLVDQERPQRIAGEVVLTQRGAADRRIHGGQESAQLKHQEGARFALSHGPLDGVDRLAPRRPALLEGADDMAGGGGDAGPLQRCAALRQEGEEMVLQNGLGQRAQHTVVVRVERLLVLRDGRCPRRRQIEGVEVVDVAQHAMPQEPAQLEGLVGRHGARVVEPGQVVGADRPPVGVVLGRQLFPFRGPERPVGGERLHDLVGVVAGERGVMGRRSSHLRGSFPVKSEGGREKEKTGGRARSPETRSP